LIELKNIEYNTVIVNNIEMLVIMLFINSFTNIPPPN